ncbi:hypothetical protein GCM10027215_15210 [Nocardioides zeae]
MWTLWTDVVRPGPPACGGVEEQWTAVGVNHTPAVEAIASSTPDPQVSTGGVNDKGGSWTGRSTSDIDVIRPPQHPVGTTAQPP